MAKTSVAERLNTYFPKLKQYRSAGIRVWILGKEVEIRATGYLPRGPEEQAEIEALMKRDPFCGIAREGQQEMSVDAKKATDKVTKLQAENDQLHAELRVMRERLALQQAAGGKAKGE